MKSRVLVLHPPSFPSPKVILQTSTLHSSMHIGPVKVHWATRAIYLNSYVENDRNLFLDRRVGLRLQCRLLNFGDYLVRWGSQITYNRQYLTSVLYECPTRSFHACHSTAPRREGGCTCIVRGLHHIYIYAIRHCICWQQRETCVYLFYRWETKRGRSHSPGMFWEWSLGNQAESDTLMGIT